MTYVCLENLVRFRGQKRTPINAKVFLPQDTTDGDWLCVIEIQGLEKSGRFRAFGADGLQAMRLGISTLVTLIEASEEWKSGEIYLQSDDGSFEKLEASVLASLK